jgi:hypothetical protein
MATKVELGPSCAAAPGVLDSGNFSSEEWRPVVGWPAYEVSSEGRVKRVLPGRGVRETGGVLRSGADSGGYQVVSVSGVTKRVHRLVAAAFIGPCPPGFQVNHVDGAKSNNSLGNLEYVSAVENMAHARRLGISPLPARARLNDQAVRVIRFMVSRGVSPARLAALHGVRVEAIYKLLARQTWKWVS